MATLSAKTFAYAIYEASEGKDSKGLEEVLSNTTKILADKHMLGKKEEIFQYVQEIVDEKEGIVRARVDSATKLSKSTSAEIEKELKERYKAKEVRLEEFVDTKYLGGIRIQVGDEVIDLTLSHKINQLQNYLITQ